MTRLNEVWQLIQSMTRTEKRYFKMSGVFTSDNKDFLSLYSLFEQGLSADEVRQQFEKTYGKRAFEPALHYLFKVLMAQLMQCDRDKGVEVKLLYGIHECKVLFRKRLFDLCFKTLNRYKSLAIKQEKFSFFAILNRMELEYRSRLDFENYSDAQLVELQYAGENALQQELNIHRHTSLYQILQHRYVNNLYSKDSGSSISGISDLAMAEIQLLNALPSQSFELRKIHLLFQSIYCMMQGDYEAGRVVYRELDSLFEQKRELWLDAPVFYLYHLSTVLSNLRATRQFNEMDFYLAKFDKVDTTLSDIQWLAQSVKLEFTFLKLTDTGQFHAANQILELLEPYLLQPLQQSSGGAARLMLFRSLIDFGLGKTQAAMVSLRRYLHQSQTTPSVLQTNMRLFLCLLLYELNETDYLQSEIRSLERMLIKNNQLGDFVKTLFSLLKQPSITGKNDKKLVLLNQLLQLCSQSNSDKYRSFFYYLNIQAWIRAQLSNMSYAQILCEL